MVMLIRPATPADIPVMIGLEQQAEAAAHWSRRDYDALFAPEAPKRVTLVAYEDKCVTGFLVARCGLDDWEIENVVVAPAQRRRGTATALIATLVRHARQAGVTSVLLEVRGSNQPARRLYERLGFLEVGCRPAYYQNPAEDALLLKFSVSVP